ncbi:MAG: hypothetical protein WA830_22525 [Candidatus Sulfotelmatobacter sp.]
MPVTYQIDPAERVIRTCCSSPVTLSEVIEHFRTLQNDPACSGSLDVLLDVSDADPLPDSAQIGAVKTELSAIRGKVQFGICAVIATRDAMFGMMRMFEVLAGPYFLAIRVFRGKPEAEAWMLSQRAAR